MTDRQQKIANVLAALRSNDVRALSRVALPELAELRDESPELAEALESEHALELLCRGAAGDSALEDKLSALDRDAQSSVNDVLLTRIKQPLPEGITPLDVYEALRALDTLFLDMAAEVGDALVWKGPSLVTLRVERVKSFRPPSEPTILHQSVLEEELAESLECWLTDGSPAPRVDALLEWIRGALSQVPELLWNFVSAPVEDALLLTRIEPDTAFDGDRWARRSGMYGPLHSQAFNRTWVWAHESSAWLVAGAGHEHRPHGVPEQARCAIIERADLNFVLASFLAQPQQTLGGVSGMAVPVEQYVEEEYKVVLEQGGTRIELQTF